jgi:DNA-binding NarL/FixJ family response regulator
VTSMRVILADDNSEMLNIELKVLRPEYSVVGTYSDGYSLLRDGLPLDPDFAVLDISMGPINGLELAKRIHAAKPSARIVFLTIHEQPEFVEAGMQAGASAYVFKRRLFPDLLNALHAVSAGNVFVSSPD